MTSTQHCLSCRSVEPPHAETGDWLATGIAWPAYRPGCSLCSLFIAPASMKSDATRRWPEGRSTWMSGVIHHQSFMEKGPRAPFLVDGGEGGIAGHFPVPGPSGSLRSPHGRPPNQPAMASIPLSEAGMAIALLFSVLYGISAILSQNNAPLDSGQSSHRPTPGITTWCSL